MKVKYFMVKIVALLVVCAVAILYSLGYINSAALEWISKIIIAILATISVEYCADCYVKNKDDANIGSFHDYNER